MPAAGEHVEHEDHDWSVAIPDHPARTESAAFRHAKTAAHKILTEIGDDSPWVFGPGPYQMHHGGSVWVNVDGSSAGWRLVLGPFGIEWSMQFCADPAKVDIARQFAADIVAGFPHTLPSLRRVGYPEGQLLLTTSISTARHVADWTDGLYNSCVPLPASIHTGVLPRGWGYHHYPKPIVDAICFKRDDWPLFVPDGDTDGSHVAVVPTEAEDGSVEVVHAPESHPLHAAHAAAHARGERLILPADHPLARKAHRR